MGIGDLEKTTNSHDSRWEVCAVQAQFGVISMLLHGGVKLVCQDLYRMIVVQATVTHSHAFVVSHNTVPRDTITSSD